MPSRRLQPVIKDKAEVAVNNCLLWVLLTDIDLMSYSTGHITRGTWEDGGK